MTQEGFDSRRYDSRIRRLALVLLLMLTAADGRIINMTQPCRGGDMEISGCRQI